MISSEMPLKNDDRLNIRLPGDLLVTLEEIQKKHGLNATEIARRCLEAVADFYNKHGFFSFPVRLEPEAGFIERAIQYGTSVNLGGLDKEKAAETTRAKATGKKAG